MKPSLAARQVLSVSACCCSMRSKSGSRCPRTNAGVRARTRARASVTTAARTAEASMPQILHRPERRPGGWSASLPALLAENQATRRALLRSGLRARRAGMRPGEPVAQLTRGLIRRRSVERHERGRHAGNSDDVGAPSILGDRRHLDEIGASSNGFFETMNREGHVFAARLQLKNETNCTHT